MEQNIDNSDQNKSKENTSLLECIICMTSPAEDPVVTQCGHIFCWPCIRGWVNNSNKMFCPTCKNGIKLENVIPLYANSSNKYNDKPKNERIDPQVNQNRPGFFQSIYRSFTYAAEDITNARPLNAKEVQANQIALGLFIIIVLIIFITFYFN